MCDPPAIIEWTNVRILRPGRAPPTRPTRRTVAFTRASNPSRWVSVATSNNPALATRFESSKVTSIRSIACDTRLTGSASWLPDNDGFRHPHRPSPGGLSRGYATRHTHDRSVHRGLVFVSYAREDREVCRRLALMLGLVLGGRGYGVWWDDTMVAGVWRDQIDRSLDRAVASVFLVSEHSLTSEFIMNEELPRLLARGRVAPIYVRPCPWRSVAAIAELQFLGSTEQALTEQTGDLA